jgi:hypothetical protein
MLISAEDDSDVRHFSEQLDLGLQRSNLSQTCLGSR